MSHTTRRFASSLVIAILAGNAAQAAPWSRPSSPVSEEGLFSAAWRWLAHLLPDVPFSQTKEGCGMDPNGRCIPTPPSTAEAGSCGMDPDGTPRCAPSAGLSDAGGMMDPNGLR